MRWIACAPKEKVPGRFWNRNHHLAEIINDMDEGQYEKLLLRLRSRMYIDPVTGCWLPTRSVNQYGYAMIRINGDLYPLHMVQRIVRYGTYPDHVHLGHTCSNPSCFRPEHVRPIIAKVNAFDLSITGEEKKSSRLCSKGHELTDANSHWIKKGGVIRRKCRICKNAWNRAYYHRQKAAKRACNPIQNAIG